MHRISLTTCSFSFAAAALSFIATLACNAAAPVLVLNDTSSANPFGAYFGEILRGEGLNAFDERSRQAWSASPTAATDLAQYQAVVLGEMNFTSAEQQRLRQYVADGGVLLAARPQTSLEDLFGIEFAGNRAERLQQFFAPDPSAAATQGFPTTPLQYHGVAANYELRGAGEGLAYLYANPDLASGNPAITSHNHGAGKAIAFSFDPAKSVVLTRQGNPAWKNTEGDGIAEYRPHDFFVRTDGRSYYDPDRIATPHADELQRLVANVLQDAVEAPLPRMWYLPGAHKSIMINTGDGEDNFDYQFDQVLNDAASFGGKFSVYLRDYGVANTSVAKEATWRAAGHEVGVHMYADGAEGAGAVTYMTYAYNRVTSALQNKFGHGARTARSHSIDWTGWTDMASIEASQGTQLDTNFYHYLNGGVVSPLTTNGYFTGSGLPQKFITEQGAMLDIYQAATQWPDEWFANNGLSAQQTFNIIKTMFEAAENDGYYSAFVNNIHPVRYDGPDVTSDWSLAVWAYCRDNDIPMWSAEMLLDFTLARNATKFENLVHSTNTLEFDYVAGGDEDLTLMIPLEWGIQELAALTMDGQSLAWSSHNIKGVDYAFATPLSATGRIVANYGVVPSADFDSSGIVDAQDLAAWQLAFGDTANADADLDTDSDGADFLAWQQQLTPSQTSTSPIPEPCSSALFTYLLAATIRLHKRRAP